MFTQPGASNPGQVHLLGETIENLESKHSVHSIQNFTSGETDKKNPNQGKGTNKTLSVIHVRDYISMLLKLDPFLGVATDRRTILNFSLY